MESVPGVLLFSVVFGATFGTLMLIFGRRRGSAKVSTGDKRQKTKALRRLQTSEQEAITGLVGEIVRRQSAISLMSQAGNAKANARLIRENQKAVDSFVHRIKQMTNGADPDTIPEGARPYIKL